MPKKVKFFHSEFEDNLEATKSKVDGDTEEIWKRLQAGGLIPETFTFYEYAENDSKLQSRETIPESSILDDLRTTGEGTSQEEKEDASAEEVEPTISSPTEASALMRQLDKYLRSHNDSDEILRLLAKILQYVVDKSISKTKQRKISNFFARLFNKMHANIFVCVLGWCMFKVVKMNKMVVTDKVLS